jgi:hypothetical protein
VSFLSLCFRFSSSYFVIHHKFLHWQYVSQNLGGLETRSTIELIKDGYEQMVCVCLVPKKHQLGGKRKENLEFISFVNEGLLIFLSFLPRVKIMII